MCLCDRYFSYNINKIISFYFPQTDTIFIKNMKHYVHISVTVLKLVWDITKENCDAANKVRKAVKCVTLR
jgi:hypothetical protein